MAESDDKHIPTVWGLRVLNVLIGMMVLVALIDLGLRAALRFDGGWDSLWYHLPFAAKRVGIDLPYETTVRLQHYYEGFPPLPDFLEGVLWRVTGSVNGTGVVGYLGFVGFLVYCRRVLRLQLRLVALVALTAPLVVIHTSSTYVDLFSNCGIAAAAGSCLVMVMFPERTTRGMVYGGLVGAAVTAWSKLQLAPLAGVFFVFVAVLAWRRQAIVGMARKRLVIVIVAVGAIAAAPYAKNFIVYGNPFWPIRLPVIGDALPSAIDAVDEGIEYERPAALRHVSQPELFVRSLFETDNDPPKEGEPRWRPDQGAPESFRIGGFWWCGTVFYLLATVAMFVLVDRRRGLIAGAGMLGVLLFVAVTPQSNELRYFLFIPLAWAAGFAAGFPVVRERYPRVALGGLALAVLMFGYMVRENWSYYEVERRGLDDAAREYQVEHLWAQLQPGTTYCAVHYEPAGLLLTGPTLSEFSIIDRYAEFECPPGSVVMAKGKTFGAEIADEAARLLRRGRFAEAAEAAGRALQRDPSSGVAWMVECEAYVELGRWQDAITACTHARNARAHRAKQFLDRARAEQAKVEAGRDRLDRKSN